jgi:hypothetical protein
MWGLRMESHRRNCRSLILAVLLNACSRTVGASSQEVGRFAAPAREIEAVVMESATGATVPTIYEVFIVPSGRVPTREDLVLKVDQSSKPTIEWRGPADVTLACDDGRVWHYQNFASIPLSEGKLAAVSISLACGGGGYRRRR